ncbi:MAG: tol-pal system-associated acyl-CoA thioesterase [Gammaproteobacteria bacterium]|nr:tol-pal system-associated acyl-CoA thioesterase [Gammaproteobacteria bacterium]
MASSASGFTLPVRVYYEDTDSGGVVYHANYLKFMERARTEWLRVLGFEQDRLEADQGVVFAVSRMEIDFIRPARFNDALYVQSYLQRQRRASLLFRQEIVREQDGGLLCAATVQVACVDTVKFRPARIPPNLISRLTNVV